MPGQRQRHYLRPNESERSPACVLWLDSETRAVIDGDDEVLVLRLWVLRVQDRRPPRHGQPRHVTHWGRDAAGLAAAVDKATTGRDTVTVFCHNLGFDLVATRLPVTMHLLGWSVSDAAVGGRAPWMRLVRKRKSITLCDSASWLPLPLADIGERIGVTKPPLPADEDSETAWLARCGADVDIMATAMGDLLDWWDRRKLGNWSLSGAATGWNAYRHRPTVAPVLVDPDVDTVKRDRDYVHGGRRGVWSIGSHTAGPFYDLDFVAAYPTIAAHEPHPVRRAYTFGHLDLADPVLSNPRFGVAATCLLRSTSARFPVRIDRATWYPVGWYWADLAGPEIAEAARLGMLRSISRGEAHHCEPQMANWARWVLDVQHRRTTDAPEAAVIAAKAWGRSVIGKWSARSFERVKLGPSPVWGWGYERGLDHDSGARGAMVDIAGTRWWVQASGEPENCYPAIHAWVESHVRARLSRVIDALGESAVLQCDTDGLIVAGRIVGTRAAHGALVAPDGLTAQGRLDWCLAQIDPVTAPLQLRVKHRADHVQVTGPQHVQLDAQRRLSGIPSAATQQPDGRYQWRAWPKMTWQMEHGGGLGYRRPLRSARADGPYPGGWILRDRTVVPVETTATKDGRTVIIPWHRTAYAARGLHRADYQHPVLDALI